MERHPANSLDTLAFNLIRPLGMKLDAYGRHMNKDLCLKSTRLLDIGCGNGDFIKIESEMEITATGCDPDSEAIDYCHSLGLDAFHGDVHDPRIETSSYDLITMNHVIEHISNPENVQHRAYSILKPGGSIWIALPNPGAFGIKIFGSSWRGFHPPFHLTIRSQNVLANWISNSGFCNVRLCSRGHQSSGPWRCAIKIHLRDNHTHKTKSLYPAKYIADMVALISTRWSEETIFTTTKPHAKI
jgi:SAM-dependent methyltransferase